MCGCERAGTDLAKRTRPLWNLFLARRRRQWKRKRKKSKRERKEAVREQKERKEKPIPYSRSEHSMDRWYGGRGGRGRGMLPLLALHAASEYYRLGRKPPVTAGLILANTLIYLRPGALHRLLPDIDDVWFNPYLILKYGDLKRFILSAFYHVSEPHLVYNMLSLLWKGIQLESSMGSVNFASMIVALLGLSQGITLLLARGLLIFFNYETAYYKQYAVGFSGVLFAMKVVLNSQSDDYTYVHGMVIPSRHAAWAELILIQLFVPGVSFLGHLGGVLAGLVYLQLRGSLHSGSDPLTALIRRIVGIVSWPLRFVQRWLHSRRHRITGRGRAGRSSSWRDVPDMWRCPECTYDNSAWAGECEMCGTTRRGHGYTPGVPVNRNNELSLEELRRRRLERFGR